MAKVLIGEDVADLRMAINLVLGRAGHEVSWAVDGPSTLAAVRATRPDLLVLDVAMPGLTGLEVCREIRADQRLADLPVLMLSARALEGDVVTGRDAGADDYVVKPFTNAELVARVNALLDEPHS